VLLKEALRFSHVSTPRVIIVNKDPAYSAAMKELKERIPFVQPYI
jgi:transposase-like protein